MERVRKSKLKATLDGIFFATPEQKLLRFLISEPTTSFTPRVLSSKLKGVRGLGGADGINKILRSLVEIGLVRFVNNNREVSVENDNLVIQILKTFSSICDLEGVRDMLQEVTDKGILYGSRADGSSSSDSNYNVFVVTREADQVKSLVTKHPLGRKIEVVVCDPDDYAAMGKKNPSMAKKLDQGIVMWGSAW